MVRVLYIGKFSVVFGNYRNPTGIQTKRFRRGWSDYYEDGELLCAILFIAARQVLQFRDRCSWFDVGGLAQSRAGRATEAHQSAPLSVVHRRDGPSQLQTELRLRQSSRRAGRNHRARTRRRRRFSATGRRPRVPGELVEQAAARRRLQGPGVGRAEDVLGRVDAGRGKTARRRTVDGRRDAGNQIDRVCRPGSAGVRAHVAAESREMVLIGGGHSRGRWRRPQSRYAVVVTSRWRHLQAKLLRGVVVRQSQIVHHVP